VTATGRRLPATQELILEVLAARYRTGELFWTFPTTVKWALLGLADAGLVEVMSSPEPRTLRAKLTRDGQDRTLSLTYQVPVPTLAAALDTLPAGDEQYLAWMRRHGLGHGAGVATVISAVRADLRRLLASDDRRT
jgi:hypothetical protein